MNGSNLNENGKKSVQNPVSASRTKYSEILKNIGRELKNTWINFFIISRVDVKGELQYKFGHYRQEKGYTIRSLNLKNPEKLDRYNPFLYIEKEEDLIRLITNLHEAVKKPDAMQGKPFWDDGVDLYLQAIFYYE